VNQAPFLDILVVDDGSTDSTASEARRSGARVTSHAENLGIGAAMRTGMTEALERGYDMAVQVDGDGQHDPSQVYLLLAPIKSGQADVAVGSRFLSAGGYRPPWHRRLGTLLLAAAVSAATGRRATDTTSGFRAMNRKALSFLAASYPTDYPESESLVLMHAAGIRWVEVPVNMRSRFRGVSSIRSFTCLLYMAKVLVRIARDATRLRIPRAVPDRG
jgi:glycosyltransferase involved in cell wall biosynthesis